jgi:diguanylate cyclase (GGDEF)-like protein/PAS domain S-box-containing protein
MNIRQRLKDTSPFAQWVFLGTALLILGSLIGCNLYSEHDAIYTQESARLATQAKIVDENLGSQLLATSLTLDSIRSDLPFLYAQKNGKDLLNHRLQAMNDAMPGVRTLLILDSEGTAVASNQKELIGGNFRNREYFQIARQSHNSTVLHVSPPFKTILGAFVITLTKTVLDSRGEFAGVITAALNPEYFNTLLDSVRYAPNMETSLVDAGGKLFLIRPENHGIEGINLAKPGSFFSRHRESGQTVTVLAGITGFPNAGKERLMVLRTVRHASLAMDKPLVVTVARDLPDIFAVWRENVFARGGIFGVLVLISALNLYFFQKRQQAYRQSERARHTGEEQLRSFYDLGMVGLAITSPVKGWVRVNEYLCNMLEYSEKELRRLPWLQFIHPDDLAASVEQFDKLLTNEISGYSLEQRLLSRTGKIIFTNLVARCVRKTNGEVDYVTTMVTDITERKRAEASILRENDFTHAMLDSLPGLFYLIDEHGRFLRWNRNFERISGYCANEISTMTLLDFFGESDKGPVADAIKQVYEQGEALVDAQFLAKDRTLTPFLFNGKRCLLEQKLCLMGMGIDMTARKEAEERIWNLAYFDPLTNLPNRRLIMDRLGHALITSNRTAEYGALMILDLDNFKTLNDTKGHDAGDRLLIEVAQRIIAGVRSEDTVSRLGGDEYMVMLERLGTDETSAANQVEMVAEKIRIVLNQPYVLFRNGHAYHSTPSIGVTLFRGNELSIDALLKQADMALYQAKGAGRNAVRFFNPAMQATIESRSRMEAALRNGLQNNEFQLYYQPQVDQKGNSTGAEALLRWLSPDQEQIPPSQFIPLAEDTGLIIPLGLWVMQTACAQLRAWSENPGTRHLQISINVSARQFRQENFVAQVFDALKRSGANPALLRLELTESIVLENIDDVIMRMQQIKALGVTFSLDDFGTGFSSLSYLKRLPLDEVKIDQSFVRDITSDSNDAAIVRAIIAMSHSLGIEVIAEGVETETQLHFLKENGCMNFQGYLFGKPMAIGKWNA